MKVNAYGRERQISRRGESWIVLDCGSEGKKRLAGDIVIPGVLPESRVVKYLEDLLHEHATQVHPEVRLIE